MSMTNLASTYVKVGKAKEAVALQEQVVEKFRALAEDHPLKGTKMHSFVATFYQRFIACAWIRMFVSRCNVQSGMRLWKSKSLPRSNSIASKLI